MEIPKLRPAAEEGYNDPLLNYVWGVSNEFWPGFDGKDFSDSLNPGVFVERMEKGEIECRDEWWQSYLQDEELQQSLNLFGIDTDEKKAAFFYLCLMVKDYAVSRTADAMKKDNTPRENIRQLIEALEKMNPERVYPDSDLHWTFENVGTLTYKYKKCEKEEKTRASSFIIDDGDTLNFIRMALTHYLKINPMSNHSQLDCVHIGSFDRIEHIKLGQKHLLFLFHQYIYWWLKQQKKVPGVYANADRWLMVSKMVYHVGISSDKRFLGEKEEKKLGKGNEFIYPIKAKHLKGIISKVKEEDIKTLSNIYW